MAYLASMNLRYEPIAKEVFQKRFEKKYFVIEGETERHRNEYSAQLTKFGDSVRAIEARYIRDIDENHWMAQLVQKYTPNLEKLCFHNCLFRNAVEFLSRHLNLSHLTIRGGSNENTIYLPEYKNLKAIEISETNDVDAGSLLRTLQNNPQLESVIIRPSNPKYCFFTSRVIVELVSNHLRCLKELNILGRYDYDDPEITINSMDQFVSSLESLESFGMSILRYSEMQLFSKLSAHCKRITSLEIKCYMKYRNFFQNICAFDRLETLSLSNIDNQEELELIVLRLPHLRSLTISGLCNRTNDEILSIVRKCSLLEHLTIESRYFEDTPQNDGDENGQVCYYKLNVSFHDEFVRIIHNRNTKLSFRQFGLEIGLVTKHEIIWRNKLLHWTGYSRAKSQSKLHLLDLASIPKESKAQHEQPLNSIFNYLDLNSLYAFFRVNEECKQLVHNYIYQRCKPPSKQQFEQKSIHRGKLLITDEFGIYSNMLHTFGKTIINLEVVFYMQEHQLRDDIEKYCKNLTTLYVRVHPFLHRAHFYIFPQVRYFIYDTIDDEQCYNCCVLDEVARTCPDIEILEFKAPITIWVHNKEKITFRNLKKIKFIPYDDKGIQDVIALFKNTSTEIIIEDK